MTSYVRLGRFLDRKKYILGSIVLIGLFIVFMVNSFAVLTPVSSVTVPSTTLNYSNNDEGSWQYTKFAEWISKGKVRVTINLETVEKKKSDYTDVILVLDTSGSMYGDKLNQMQDDVISFVTKTISKGNKIALITFNDTATIENDFTNSSLLLRRNINNLVASGETNYYQALVKVDDVLSNYTKEDNRDCVVLFLTDGFPTVDTPNEIPQYRYLKTKYEYLSINGIQYEFNTSEILDWVKNVTDMQYVADMESLNEFLYRASISAANYDSLTLTDYVDTDYFNLKNISNIDTTFGTASVIDNRVVWNLNGLRSGTTATLTMDTNLNDNLVGVGGIYSTHSRTDVSYSIGTTSTTESSTLTPILKDNYVVNYEVNTPSGCVISNMPSSKSYSVFDIVKIEDRIPTCEGYQFKKWEIVTENVKKISSNHFEMPDENVTIRAVWKKVGLLKSMNGTIAKSQTLYKIVAEDSIGLDTNVNFESALTAANSGVYTLSGTENDQYPVHYYRGIIDYNNVLFADFCWKMVRTTSTGGVKLVYNGLPFDVYDQYVPIAQSKYIITSNDATYPYTYNTTNNRWTSTNKIDSSTSTISFSVVESGTYILSYSVSSEQNWDKVYFYKDNVEIGIDSGTNNSTISLGELSSSNVITIKYSKNHSDSLGTDSVSFSLDKATGRHTAKSCDHSGMSTQIGTSVFNSNVDSPADVGYMYGERLLSAVQQLSTSVDVLSPFSIATDSNYYYGSSITYSGGVYTLRSASQKTWADNYNSLTGYYTCRTYSTTCTTVYYIVGTTSYSQYGLSLSGGVTNISTPTITLGSNVTSNGNGTYTLTNPVTLQGKDWYANYKNYDSYYMCEDLTSTTCGSVKSIVSTNNYSLSYYNTKGYIFGNGVSWNGTKYTLTDTFTLSNSLSTDKTTLFKKRYYTCFNTTGECTNVYYMLSFSSVSAKVCFAILTGGKGVDDMFTNTNSSEIKKVVDTWYNTNMTSYTWKLEDTIWCNDRTIIETGAYSMFGAYNRIHRLYRPSVICPNVKRDGFTVSTAAGGNGMLTYPVGLLTADEGYLAGNDTDSYLYTGQRYWFLSPAHFTGTIAFGFGVHSSGSVYGGNTISISLGIRPSISLVAETKVTGGDGTAENPYVIDMDN